MLLDKFLDKLGRLLKMIISNNYIFNHKFQNKNQVTNSNLILNLLKRKNFNPTFIVDVGCGHGEWTIKSLNIFPNSKYYLFDANTQNNNKLSLLKKKFKNINYEICLLSNDISQYDFFNMGYGSSIYEEQTNNKRYIEKIKSDLLINKLPNDFFKSKTSLIKLDVQGAEKKVLEGLKESISLFEVVIMEVSLHNYNKNAPLFENMIEFMKNNNFRLYDIFDLKRLGNHDSSFLLQFDCVFARSDSNLLNVKF
tara:strand:+ start:56 stop:811 length:756 start_codon:yes stop_codon:yes gene_type:complete